MTDEVQHLGEGVEIHDELQRARDELRPRLHLASADTLGAIEMIEREIERISSASIDQALLRAAVARMRHVSAALERARVARR